MAVGWGTVKDKVDKDNNSQSSMLGNCNTIEIGTQKQEHA